VLLELEDSQEPLVIDGHLHESFDHALADEAINEVEGWTKEEDVLNEKEIAVNVWTELVQRERQKV
jgi:hypothetical protein